MVDPPSGGQSASSDDIATLLGEFLEVAITLLLSVRGIYPQDSTWEILIYSKQLPGDATDKGHFWIPAETKHWQQPPLIMPIKSMNSEPLDLQLYIEHPSIASD